MKQYSVSLFLTLVCLHVSIAQDSTEIASQEGEFTLYKNGLIYSPFTMSKLQFIVDSLNIRFRTCDLHKTYYSFPQTIAHHILIEGKQARKVKAELNKGISLLQLKQKYPQLAISENIVVGKFKGDATEEWIYKQLPADPYTFDRGDVAVTKQIPSVKGKWVYDSMKDYLSAFYFLEDFKQQTLPDTYARFIQYSDCMVDTTAQLFLPTAKASRTHWFHEPKTDGKVGEFFTLVNSFPNAPHSPQQIDRSEEKDTTLIRKNDEEWELYYTLHKQWDKRRIQWLEDSVAKTPLFKQLLEEAIDQMLKDTLVNPEMEWYASHFSFKEKALQLKRNRIVVGQCSMDFSPRRHVQELAILAAETTNWEVFLRSHLDIMNDNFQRVSDGSYAWGMRDTYIKELEELNINVLDLLLGICLRIENPSQNHYDGDIGRVGRALAESKYAPEFKKRIVEMVQDTALDYNNRILMCYLFLNYNFHLQDKQEKKSNMELIQTAAFSLPESIRKTISFENFVEEE